MPSVVVPVNAPLSVNGTGKLETDYTGTFSWVDAADMNMAGGLSAAALVGIFTVAAPTSDNAADFTVDINQAGEAAYVSALATAMLAAATSAGGYSNANDYKAAPSGSSLEAYLLNVAQHDIDADLQEADGIAASLAAEQVKDLALTDLSTACTAAAQAVYDAFEGSAALRKTLAQQLPNSAWIAPSNDVTERTEVPFNAGDDVKFRFTAGQTFVISEEAGYAAVDLSSNVAPGGGGTLHNTSSAGYAVNSKIIDITLTLA